MSNSQAVKSVSKKDPYTSQNVRVEGTAGSMVNVAVSGGPPDLVAECANIITAALADRFDCHTGGA